MTSSIIQAGLAGFHAATSKALESTQAIARSLQGDSGQPLENALIGLKESELQARASARVIKVGAEVEGALVDILA